MTDDWAAISENENLKIHIYFYIFSGKNLFLDALFHTLNGTTIKGQRSLISVINLNYFTVKQTKEPNKFF